MISHIRAYRDHLVENSLKASTCRKYMVRIEQLEDALLRRSPDLCLLSASRDDLVDFLVAYCRSTVPSTVKTMPATMRNFYRWASASGLVGADPTSGISTHWQGSAFTITVDGHPVH